MKSKNMTLMMVAIGCGLVAAFLTARLSGGSGPETVKILVAKKELPIGTMLDAKEIDNLIGFSARPKSDIPPDSITDIEQLKGKRVNRTLKTGDSFAAGDVGELASLALPEGTSKFSIRVDQVNAVSGFVDPGDKVDVILTETTHNNKARAGFVLRDMLVIGVDTGGRRNREGDGTGRATVTSVSLAVTPKQALDLAMAQKRGEIKLLLRDPNNQDKNDIEVSDRLLSIDKEKPEGGTTAPAVVEPKVSIVVTKTDVKLNTFVDEGNINELFVLKEFPAGSIPLKSFKDLAAIRGKYVVKPLDADQIVMTTTVDSNKQEVPEPKVIVTETEPKRKPVARKKFIQTIGNTHYLFIEVAPEDFRLVGPVTDLQAATKPDDEEQPEEKKPDDKKQPSKPEAKPMAIVPMVRVTLQ